MILFFALTASAAPYTLWDAAPHTATDPVLVVATPGFERPSYLPLVHALTEAGRDVHLLEFPCRDQDAKSLAASVAEAAATLPADTPVLAHGVGATLALMAHPSHPASRYVLMAPVLDVQGVAATDHLAEQELGQSVHLGGTAEWNGRQLTPLLIGGEVKLGCAPVGLARDLQTWVQQDHVPLSLDAIEAPVWMAVSIGDDIASIEAVVPASRRLPNRELVRLGVNRLDGQDFSHGELLTHPTSIHAAVHALEHP